MKKLLALLMTCALAAALLVGCGGDSSTPDPVTEVDLQTVVDAIEAVNEVPNPRAIDDLYVQFDLLLTMDNIVEYAGDVTNDGGDCALVFVAKVADGTAADVMEELGVHKSNASSSLYAEFADKVAKAKDAIITSSGNVVVYVIAGVNGPSYADIQTAINTALAQ